jgi:hypothetical protein
VHVHERDVRKRLAGELDRGLGVGRRADHVDLGLRAEQGLEHVPDGLLVIRYQHPDALCCRQLGPPSVGG